MTDLHAQRGAKYTKSRIENATRMGLANAKVYPGFISPEGDTYLEVANLSEFCRQFGLTQSAMVRVAKGELRQHKGWRRVVTDDEPGPAPNTTE